VETHQPDPTAPRQEDPWDSASSELSSLSHRLRDIYRRVASDQGPSEEDIKDAFAILLSAWDQVAVSVSTALSDPETRDHLKKAASSFAAALGTTISELGDEIRGDEIRGDSDVGDESGDPPVDKGSPGGGVVDGDNEPTSAARGR
jgi:hypothetical protein